MRLSKVTISSVEYKGIIGFRTRNKEFVITTLSVWSRASRNLLSSDCSAFYATALLQTYAVIFFLFYLRKHKQTVLETTAVKKV